MTDGLVERIPLEGDRRAMQVRLTEAGSARFTEMATDHEDWVDELLAPFGFEETETLLALLSRLEAPR